ncbi:MAG: group II intron reverse transcriptase domain-containing protein [Candidatus Kerfeldbacteria bacterium]|nr:group II intron reverse transcriptase domain-containing protein [Candidatus Kerfeldbacteria bacterium]
MTFEELVSPENIFRAWAEFRRGKLGKLDVLKFERYLEDNVFELHQELYSRTYRHQPYQTFHIYDPKHRIISKATVRDRLAHHLVFDYLHAIFDKTFIYHSYSSRPEKGTHLAVRNLATALRQVSHNYTRPAYALKCDIRKFFYSVSHQKLFRIIKNRLHDQAASWLVSEIIESFPNSSKSSGGGDCLGLPIGNLTSQIFANIYLNELDKFVTQTLSTRHYFRYADDFIMVHDDAAYLQDLILPIGRFLKQELSLELHPKKVILRKLSQGVDFLGYVVLPHYTVLRTRTKRRMFKKLWQKQLEVLNSAWDSERFNQSVQSYLGTLQHCQGFKLAERLRHEFSDWQSKY